MGYIIILIGILISQLSIVKACHTNCPLYQQRVGDIIVLQETEQLVSQRSCTVYDIINVSAAGTAFASTFATLTLFTSNRQELIPLTAGLTLFSTLVSIGNHVIAGSRENRFWASTLY